LCECVFGFPSRGRGLLTTPMFTGLVEGRGIVDQVRPDGATLALTIRAPQGFSSDPHIGESVSINGCCLTAVAVDKDLWSFEASSETLSRTNLGKLRAGEPVNLERALPVGGRFGGHFVQGHIDGTAYVERVETDGEWVTMWFRAPQALLRALVPKGSVAVDGVSLTVVEVTSDRFSVALIPHTLSVTTLGVRKPGDAVNIETDILGKYVEKLLRT
jgi:riboflavin synthase